MPTSPDIYTPGQLFRWLVLYRWASLVLPLALLLVDVATGVAWLPAGAALLGAVTLNLLIAALPQQLNRALRAHPWLLLVDLLLVAGFMALTGGWRSPYYLYALNPLLAAAFFFRLRGALLATTTFLPLYGAASLLDSMAGGPPPNWLVVLTAVVGFYLISGTFGYAATLFAHLGDARDELAEAHRDLAALHALTASLHQAADVADVQERVLGAVTEALGYRQALIGLVQGEGPAAVLTGWLGRGGAGLPANGGHIAALPLSPAGGEVAEAVLAGQVVQTRGAQCLPDARLVGQNCLILPLLWGIRPVGVLLVDMTGREQDTARRQSLEAMARQTGTSLGMMITRLGRARERAIQEERARIAQDIHDTVSQSLFGLVFTLDGCLKMLPHDPAAIAPELAWASQTADEVRQEIRQTIMDMWAEEAMTPQQFEMDLRQYVADLLPAAGLQVGFDVRGDFASLSPRARRSMYRIAQEALTNVVHHAAASEAKVCVDVVTGRARLVIRDNGRGFEPDLVLAQAYDREHFGLRGMQERARSLGGTCDLFTRPGAGTSIVVDFPASPDA